MIREIDRDMKEWGRSTHFINGYVPMAFNTENRDLFRGETKEIVGKWGKRERSAQCKKKCDFVSVVIRSDMIFFRKNGWLCI